jgi:hypothetical protein
VAGFRNSAINVLIATSVGSEGMDFKQCQLVRRGQETVWFRVQGLKFIAVNVKVVRGLVVRAPYQCHRCADSHQGGQ